MAWTPTWMLALSLITGSLVDGSNHLGGIKGWRNLGIQMDQTFDNTPFVTLSVSNNQQCVRLCWLYKACTILTYKRKTGMCQLHSLDVPDITSYLRTESTVVTIDMRSASVDESKPRGCDKRPCGVDHLCVPVVKSSSYECLTTVNKFCPDDPPVVADVLSMNDGVNQVVYQCPEGFSKSGTTNVSTCDRKNGRWSDVDISCSFVDCGQPDDVANTQKIGSETHLSAQVTYVCHEGHVAESTTSSMRVTCLDNGQWTSYPAPCIMVLCPQPVSGRDANVQLLDRIPSDSIIAAAVDGTVFSRSLGGKAEHFCKPGFSSNVGNFTSECQADGTWTTSPDFGCSRVNCSHPPILANAWRSYTSTTFQSRVDYMCKEGYENHSASQDLSLECGTSGWWEGPEIRCDPVNCGEAPEERNSTISYSDGVLYGSQAVYTCVSPGVSAINGNQTRICQANGTWSTEEVECMTCGHPYDVQNGTYQIIRVMSGIYVARYNCIEGYYIANGSHNFCTHRVSSWGGRMPTCRPIVCIEPSIPNADANYTDTGYQSVVTFRCKDGFRLIGPSNLTCSVRIIWESQTQQLPSCDPITCSGPPVEANTVVSVSDQSHSYGTVATYTCVDNNVLTTASNTRRCTAEGWEATPIKCEVLPCGNPPDVMHAEMEINSETIPMTVSYRCLEGFQLKNPVLGSKTCVTDLWTPEDVICLPVDCGTPPEVANAIVTSNATTYRGMATYMCKSGFASGTGDVASIMKRTCQKDGNWTTESLTCKPSGCENPPNRTNAHATFTSTAVGSTVSYSCIENYTYRGSTDELRLTCESSGEWSGGDMSLTCVEIDCSSPRDIPFANASYNSTKYKSKVLYNCTGDYQAFGSNEKTCSRTGNWTGDDNFKCVPTKCPTAPLVTNAIANYTGDRIAGSFAVYTCAKGFQLSKNISNITCLDDLQWSNSNVSCVSMYCGSVPHVIHANAIVYVLDNVLFAEYSCLDRYKMVDNVHKRTCAAAGADWSNDFVECAPLNETTCPEPSKINHAVHSYTSLRFDSEVKYECEEGFTHWSFETKTCTAQGIWSNNTVLCMPVNCGEPPDIARARKSYNGSEYDAIVEYSCEESQKYPLSKFKRCENDGKWSSNLVECWDESVEFCPFPSTGQNEVIEIVSLIPGKGKATITCLPGYTAAGDNYTMECDTNKIWERRSNSRFDQCQPVQCLSSIQDVQDAQISSSGRTFGHFVNYTCHDNFIRVGPESRMCHENGQWDDVLVQCIFQNEIKCSYPVLSKGTEINIESYKLGGALSYRCATGYQGSGGHAVCKFPGVWDWDGPRCQPLDCGTPPELDDATLYYTTTEYSSVAVYACLSQYRQTGPYRSTCSHEGNWTIPVSPCVHLDTCAGQIPTVLNATQEKGRDKDGIFLRYYCHQNHAPSSSKPMLRRCLWTGLWAADAFTCVPQGGCPTPLEIPNADLIELKPAVPSGESSAVYQCYTGFTVNGMAPSHLTISTFVLTCDSLSKSWSPNTTCKPVDCGEPPNNLIFEIEVNMQNSTTTFKSEAKYECLPPASGYNVSVCQADGQWSRAKPECRIPCVTPPSVPNGVITEVVPEAQALNPALLNTGVVAIQDYSDTSWNLICDEDYKYLGPEVDCTWDPVTQQDKWTGIDDDPCQQIVFRNQTTPFEYKIPLHKRRYYDSVKVCAEGYFLSKAIFGTALFYSDLDKYTFRAVVRPRKETISLDENLDGQSNYYMRAKKTKFKSDQSFRICLTCMFAS